MAGVERNFTMLDADHGSQTIFGREFPNAPKSGFDAIHNPEGLAEMKNRPINKRFVEVGSKNLEGILRVPKDSIGLVVFAHGAGSSHLSPRNNFVAESLGQRGIATLLFDLLTEAEAFDRNNVFDIPLLSERLLEAVSWAHIETELVGLPVGLFGSSTGAAAALVAAAHAPDRVDVVVSRGGRADMAGEALPKVRSPTLLIVGGRDGIVVNMNEEASNVLCCKKRLEIVLGATHLFEEPGALDQVVALAGDWFEKYLHVAGEK